MNINYIYPPRPKNTISPTELQRFDNGSLFAQPKLDGSCGVLIIENGEYVLMNRHNEVMTNIKIDKNELLGLYRGNGRIVLVGEYLNKNKKHIDNKDFNHKFVIFDILVYEGIHLLGKTFNARQDLLNQLFRDKSKPFDTYIRKISNDTFIVENFLNGFFELYQNLVKIDIYEGIVMKMKYAPLEQGKSSDNNHKTQIKARKETKNYSY